MLDSYLNQGAIKVSPFNCFRDPENVLQAARERLAKLELGLRGLRDTAYMPTHSGQDGDRSLLALIGSVTVSIWREEENIDQILKGIDSAKK